MIYPIYIYGSPVLREECMEVEREYPELEKLVSDMFDTDVCVGRGGACRSSNRQVAAAVRRGYFAVRSV